MCMCMCMCLCLYHCICLRCARECPCVCELVVATVDCHRGPPWPTVARSAGRLDEPFLESYWCVPLLRTFAPDTVGGASLLGTDSPLTPELVERFLAVLALPKPLLSVPAFVDPSEPSPVGGGTATKGVSSPKSAEELLTQVLLEAVL